MSLKIKEGENTEKPPSAPAPTPAPPRSNVFTPKAKAVANEGEHWATVVFTEYIGVKQTKEYGEKDWQMFHLRVKQTNAKGVEETAVIHQQFHRSHDDRAAIVRFLAGFGLVLQEDVEFDFDDLIGRKVRIVVTHRKRGKQIHANAQALPFVPGLKPPIERDVVQPPSLEPEPGPKMDYRRQRLSELRGYVASGNDPDGHWAQKADELERQIKAEGGTCENL